MNDLPLALVKCCTTYVITMRLPVPACGDCGEVPEYLGEAGMTLTFESQPN